MSVLVAFFIGVAASAAASLLVWLVAWGYVPLIRRLIRVDDIAGEWIGKYCDDGRDYTERIFVTQVGMSIKAKAHITEDGKPTEIQRIKGAYRNQILTAEYWSNRTDTVERGTFTLRKKSRELLEGCYIFFPPKADKARSVTYVWKRP